MLTRETRPSSLILKATAPPARASIENLTIESVTKKALPASAWQETIKPLFNLTINTHLLISETNLFSNIELTACLLAAWAMLSMGADTHIAQ